MSSRAAIEALRRYKAKESQEKKDKVLIALEEMSRSRTRVTIAAVARTAKVSREFIHSHPALHAAISAELGCASHGEPGSSRGQGVGEAGPRADKSTLLARVERDKKLVAQLRETVAGLQTYKRLWLGSQLENMVSDDSAALADLRIAHERLVTDNNELSGRIAESRRLIAVLEKDLAASRQAHMEDVERLSDDGKTVIAFGRPSK